MDPALSFGFISACIFAAGGVAWLLTSYRLTARKALREQERSEGQVRVLERRLVECERRGRLTRYECETLCEFISEPDVERGMRRLLSRLAPASGRGFAVILGADGTGGGVRLSSGLSDESVASFELDADWLSRVPPGRTWEVEPKELLDSRLFASLSQNDRRKVRRLFLIGIGQGDSLTAVLITTDLFPPGAEKRDQIRLTSELMTSVSTQLGHWQSLRQQTQKLKTTQEILHIRAATDDSSLQADRVITEVLDRVRSATQSDRASLFVVGERLEPPTCRMRLVPKLPDYQQSAWTVHEEAILKATEDRHELSFLGKTQLEAAGIDTLVRSAIVIPLAHSRGPIGFLVLSRAGTAPDQYGIEELCKWVGRFLTNLLLQVVQQADIERQARTDGLTGLANRAAFDAEMERQFARVANEGAECSLLLLDLDHFKSVNDKYGHQAGDEVLRQVASMLREEAQSTRSTDRLFLGRYGGEELVVLMPSVNLAGAERFAESLRARIAAAPVKFGRQEIPVTTSLGVACAPLHAETPAALLSAADAALYDAKHQGRNRVSIAARPSETASPIRTESETGRE